MLIPIIFRNWGFRYVCLLGVVLGIAVGLSDAGHGGWLRDVLRVDGGLASSGLVRRHVAGEGGGIEGGEGREFARQRRQADRSGWCFGRPLESTKL